MWCVYVRELPLSHMRPVPPPVGDPLVQEPLASDPLAVLRRVPEAAIQDAWVRGLFDASDLRTTGGERVGVLSPGRLNRDSGPDVTDVRITLDGLTWAGDVEVHRTSSGWDAHGHADDPAYNRVVLHVVLSADRRTNTLRRADGTALPELVLLPHLDRSLRALLREFYVEPREAPHCAPRWSEVDTAHIRQWVRRLGVERLRSRARALGHAYTRRPDLDRLLIGRVARALGYSANADAMEELVRRAPLAALRQLDGTDVLAVLLGIAGFVDPALGFNAEIETRYRQIAGPLGLTSMAPTAWRRGGRPANAPRTRIAQAATLLGPGGVLRSDPVARFAEAVATGAAAVTRLLRPDPLADAPRLGLARAERIVSDAVLPVLLLDAEQREDPALESAVLNLHDHLAAATDRITRSFGRAGFQPSSALETQGLHHLARHYCQEGRCARCAVGTSLYPALRAVE